MYFVPSMVEVGEGENRTRGGGSRKGALRSGPLFLVGSRPSAWHPKNEPGDGFMME